MKERGGHIACRLNDKNCTYEYGDESNQWYRADYQLIGLSNALLEKKSPFFRLGEYFSQEKEIISYI